MPLNPLKWIAWLINEHGSATILRERLAQAKDRIANLERENSALKEEHKDFQSRLKKAQIEIDQLKKDNNELHITLETGSNVSGGGAMG